MVQNADKDYNAYFQDVPPGVKHQAIVWLQKQCMEKAKRLPAEFDTLEEWEAFRDKVRRELPDLIGIPKLPPLKPSRIRARFQVGEDVLGELVDVYADDDYSIPAYLFLPLEHPQGKLPALIFSPGWNQGKWIKSYQMFAVRMAKQGFAVMILDHAPFGETAPQDREPVFNMSLTMELCSLLGYSQMGLRVAETLRCMEYMLSRPDIDPERIALSGLCQGGMDTWFAGALEPRFAAVAPLCSATTFAIHAAEQASYRSNADASPFPHGILNLCDVDHLHEMIAPRPLMVRGNLGDDWWPMSGYDTLEARTKKVYALYNAQDKVDFRMEVNEHDLTNQFADALEAFLLRYLKAE